MTTQSPAEVPPDQPAAADTGWLGKAADTYFRTAKSPSLATVRDDLWNGDATAGWAAHDAAYQTALVEQYKIYVEMADRISARRGTANTFFLTLNTAIATAIGVLWQHPAHAPRWYLIPPWVVLVGQCLAWFWIIRSYRQLNTAKYAVVGALEERLPASPYYSAEWTAMGQGEDPSRYWPLSHVEQGIPLFFGLIYTVGLVVLLVA
jgi:hypothetical protein